MTFLQTSLMVAVVALMVERFIGYPDWLVSKIGHPVIWIGKFISLLERNWNNPEFSGQKRQISGIYLLVSVTFLTLLLTIPLTILLRLIPLGWLLEALLVTSLLSQKELGDRVAGVHRALQKNIEAGREAIRHLVGRDHRNLNHTEVSKAAIETLAENSSDGVIAPAFWLVIGGLPGAAVYKTINTCDSMVGYKNERYADFGRASARFDDFVNLLPARLSGVLYCLSAAVGSPKQAAKACKAMRRDAPKHASPNAGWPEAAVAGALDISLGGPRAYNGRITTLPWMGDGERAVRACHIREALGLYQLMLRGYIFLMLTLCIVLVFI